jgi:alpha-soluble NSF attachment protein
MAEADKKMNPSWWEKLTSANSLRYEEAADLYTKASHLFKKDKNWEAAAEACIKAAQAHLQAQSAHDAASAYVNAAQCYKQVNNEQAIQMLAKAVDLYTDAGR